MGAVLLSWDNREAPIFPFFLSENTGLVISVQCHMEICGKQNNFSRTGSSKVDMLLSVTALTILVKTQRTCLAAGCGSCCLIRLLPAKLADIQCCYQCLCGDPAPVSIGLSGSLDGQVLLLQELLPASAKEPLQSNILSSSQSIIEQPLLDLSCLNAVTLWHPS